MIGPNMATGGTPDRRVEHVVHLDHEPVSTVNPLPVLQTRRISEVAGRARQDVEAVAVATSQQLFAVPVGRLYVVQAVDWAGTNTSLGAVGRVRVRDGGVAGTFMASLVMAEATASTTTAANKAISYLDPLVFTTDVYLEVVDGTVTVDLKLVGYLEDV